MKKNFLPQGDFYHAQNKTTQAWLDQQSLWYDIDLIKVFVLGLVSGVLIGLII